MMNMSMGCSSVCEKNKDGSGGGKLKKITFKILLINSPFDWKYLLSNKWRKPLERVGKTGSKPTKKSYRKQPPKAPIYRPPKTSRYGARLSCRSTARSTANGRKSDRWGCGRLVGRPSLWNREQGSLPVDRPGLSLIHI